MAYKLPVSVLVVVHTAALDVLLLQRVSPPGFWQSVTGSLEPGESPAEAALREICEETGIAARPQDLVDWRRCNRFAIREEWRHRYAPEVSHNLEHVFSLCVPDGQPVTLAPDEHDATFWLPHDAAAAKVFSWTNRDAILQLPDHFPAGRRR
ncbi:dihydroneopterin triphosphate diphosphatase [Aromatoleum petrolei]|uniref:Dihydroneopterin triphosphate diphosphatase n=2 Tax=Aromatoleum petrolei TaxID=76116 RepID=A0ABX1MUN2_9RHOO|nr:dihydroneopterin triphosphate diphosphatase [Aromatoleum petrolei]NMF90391.1 dihydroneopterin triphosphate diphosphatase [Aromatoleum petrolei]QTQ35715.1 dATP pyrophosphohydrolase [Aromatoleum petrolei]